MVSGFAHGFAHTPADHAMPQVGHDPPLPMTKPGCTDAAGLRSGGPLDHSWSCEIRIAFSGTIAAENARSATEFFVLSIGAELRVGAPPAAMRLVIQTPLLRATVTQSRPFASANRPGRASGPTGSSAQTGRIRHVLEYAPGFLGYGSSSRASCSAAAAPRSRTSSVNGSAGDHRPGR